MNKKALLALMLVFTLLLSSCGLVVKHKDVDQKRAIVTMNGKVVATKAEVQAQVNYYLSYMAYYYSMFGYSIDTTKADVIASAQDTVIEGIKENAVIEAKAADMGVALTEEETAAGTTISDKLKAEVTKDVAVTDEEVQAELTSKADTDKSTFDTTPDTYGSRVNSGTAVYYRPAGYRMVRNLLIKYNEADERLIKATQAKVTAQTTAMTTAEGKIDTTVAPTGLTEMLAYVNVIVGPAAENEATFTDLGEEIVVKVYEATATDTFPATEDAAVQAQYDAVKEYAIAAALKDAYQADLDAATAAGLANIQEKTDAVMARLAAGEDFVTVMNEVTEDPGMTTKPEGYAVREGYANFDPAFTAAAMGIANVGEYSQPTAGSYGYYIIQYASEVTEGAVTMEEVGETLRASLLSTKQDEAYDALVEQWVSEATWVVNKEALNDND